MQPMPQHPETPNPASPPRFSGDFVWKFVGAFIASAVMWTGRVGQWFRYGAALVTVLFFTPVLNGDFRQVWAAAPAVALVYIALIVIVLGQSASRKICERGSYFYSPFGEYIFNRKQFVERQEWEQRKEKGAWKEKLESRLEKLEQKKEKLQDQLHGAQREAEYALRLASKMRSEVRLYDVLFQGEDPVDSHLLMERLLKELDIKCVAVACYESAGKELRRIGSAGARFVPVFHQEEDSDSPEIESWVTGDDIVSQNEAYPYEYMVTTVFHEELFVLVFRLDTTDPDEASDILGHIIVEHKHLFLVALRLLHIRRDAVKGVGE